MNLAKVNPYKIKETQWNSFDTSKTLLLYVRGEIHNLISEFIYILNHSDYTTEYFSVILFTKQTSFLGVDRAKIWLDALLRSVRRPYPERERGSARGGLGYPALLAAPALPSPQPRFAPKEATENNWLNNSTINI